jgi:hypothetical protein
MADSEYNSSNEGASMFSIINIAFVIIGVLLIYYFYRFLYTSAYSSTTTIVPSQQSAKVRLTTIPKFPQPYEGGDYSVNTWVYINSLNTNNKRKHLFEIKGVHFSTLLIGIGPYKNSLFVRTHHADTEGFQVPVSDYTGGIVNRVKSILNGEVEEGFQADSGSGSVSVSGSVSGSGSAAAPTSGTSGTRGTGGGGSIRGSIRGGGGTNTPNSSGKPGSLSTTDVDAMFEPMVSDDSLLTGTPAKCDIPEIDLQRWTMVTVVISGKTIDVYIDGKLNRSCVTASYFKVDPTEDVEIKVCERGGFDGYIGNTTVGNYSMNPDEIYRTYLSGPTGVSIDLLSWFLSIVKGAKLT